MKRSPKNPRPTTHHVLTLAALVPFALSPLTLSVCASSTARAEDQRPAERPLWQPDFTSAEVVPKDPSPAPKKLDWAEAKDAADARVTEPGCRVKRIREWVRVECKFVTAIERVSGPLTEVDFGCFNETKNDFDSTCDVGSVTFPLRPGDRRTFQSFRATKWSGVADSLISAQLLDGDATPLVSVQGIRGGF